MKSKITIALFLALVLPLGGCSPRQAVPPVTNNNGTQTISVPQSSASSSVSPDLDEPDAIPSAPAEQNDSSLESDNADGDVVEIKEKMFIAQINDIYLNADDYLGKTMKYEGIFDSYTWEEENLTYYYVIRYGPGCCGNDGNAGFEIVWDGDYPNKNDWVEVTGVLEAYEENGWQYLRLCVSSLKVLKTRGAEYVTQ